MASVLITGRVGSAMTAELGSMSVYEEIDALRTMRIDPVRFLVMPRFLATVISMPILVLFMDVVGWFGGALVAQVNPEIQLPMSVFFRNLGDFMTFSAILKRFNKICVIWNFNIYNMLLHWFKYKRWAAADRGICDKSGCAFNCFGFGC